MPSPIATSSIVAQAFREMEKTRPSSLGDNHDLVVAAAEEYPEALNTCLADYDYSFARHLMTLPPVSSLPAGMISDPDLPGLFTLPADFLALRKVLPDGVVYRQDGLYLRADQTTSLTIRYTRLLQNEAQMPPHFKRVVSLELADRLGPAGGLSGAKRDRIANSLARARALAVKAERNNASRDRLDGRPPQGDWADEATI